MSQLFIIYIQNFPYFGRVQYSAYKNLALTGAFISAITEQPSFEHFKKFQAWELAQSNRAEIEVLKGCNRSIMRELSEKNKKGWLDFRAKAKLKLPSIRSLTEPVGMFPTV